MVAGDLWPCESMLGRPRCWIACVRCGMEGLLSCETGQEHVWTQQRRPDLLCGHGEVDAAAAPNWTVEIQQPHVVSEMQVPGKDPRNEGRGRMVTGWWAQVAAPVSSDSLLHVDELLGWACVAQSPFVSEGWRAKGCVVRTPASLT